MKKISKIFKNIFLVIISGILVLATGMFGINSYVKLKTKNKIMSVPEAGDLSDVDCIVVLGAAVKNGDTPSQMLRDRLDKAIEVYNEGAAPKIIVSGDHGEQYYNEVGVMKNYLVERGIPSSDVFMDHAGFSTYDTMYRAKYIFKVEKIVVITQTYHMYRSLYIANKLGIEAYGVSALDTRYAGQTKRDIREFVAIDKDFVKTIFKPEALIGGEEIPVSGDGDVTNDIDFQPKDKTSEQKN